MKTKSFCLLIVFICIWANVSYAEEKTMVKVAGSGGMIPLVTELAKAYMDTHKNVSIVVRQQSIQSGGGIKGAADGTLDIGMANRGLKDDEKTLGLETAEIARVGVVIGVNKGLSIRAIKSDDLCKIYAGAIKNWSELGGGNDKILALTKPEDDATKQTIRKSISCFKDLKEADSVSSIAASPQTAWALANSKAIGITDTINVEKSNGAIIALKLDGIEPTTENVKSGKYKVVQSYRLVTKGAPTGAVKDFIDFVKGPKGAQIISASGAVHVK